LRQPQQYQLIRLPPTTVNNKFTSFVKIILRVIAIGIFVWRLMLPVLEYMTTMIERPNILVVCGRNKKRSRTAEHIFKNDNRFNIRSAGLSPNSDKKISENDLKWADLIFVMEKEHRAKLSGLFKHMDLPAIEILNITDDYEFMDEELVDMLRDRINYSLKMKYEL